MVWVVDSLTVWSDDGHLGLLGRLEQLALEHLSLWSGLAEAAADHNRPLHPPLRTLPNGIRHEWRRDNDDGQIDLVGDGIYARKARATENLSRLGVDRVDLAGKACVEDVLENLVAEFLWRGGGSDDRHTLRAEEGLKGFF